MRRLLFLLAFVSIPLLFSFSKKYSSTRLFADDSTLLKKADKIVEDADKLLPKAMELKTLFDGYKLKAGNCPKAMKEASDGFDMAEKAIKDCTEAKKLVEKARKAKKSKDIQKSIPLAEQKVHNAKYFIHESEERKKETEFELKACH
jgi:hypothetical protein